MPTDTLSLNVFNGDSMLISMSGVYRYDLDLRSKDIEIDQSNDTSYDLDSHLHIILVTRKLSGKTSTIRERIMATYAFNINYATQQNKGSDEVRVLTN